MNGPAGMTRHTAGEKRGQEPRRGRAIKVYPEDKIYEEMTFIGYYLHWNPDDIAAMSHRERIRWCDEISKINSKLNQEPENVFAI